MARKKSWFGWARRLFVSEQKPKAEKKSKRWKWFLGGFKVKQCLALPAPQRTFSASHPSRHFTKGVETLAAIKIQSAFRAYLARKALRALKGLVKLQAIVRGQAVRCQALIKMKHLPSNAKMRSEVQAKGITADGFCKNGENKHAVKSKKEVQEKETKVGEMILQLLKSKEVVEKEHKGKNDKRETQTDHMLVLNSKKSWNVSLRSKEDLEALLLKKFCNIIFLSGRGNGLLEESQLAKESGRQIFSTYMAATQSAKLKARSMSTPKQREGFQDSCFE
ncbi:hypothetical protein POTOM_052458 [Populus tomentosa]|uniref:DUF4005 domain-containing protein n=1 Tax=Populus tomentosa TaxID=118781 RepID=A0A8X7Y6F8_POPTO|nr:hypothetical protein POTOM_052458 [Populus tomentosa]